MGNVRKPIRYSKYIGDVSLLSKANKDNIIYCTIDGEIMFSYILFEYQDQK